jgi:hypothetical protein
MKKPLRIVVPVLALVVALGAPAFAQLRPHGAPEIDPGIAAAGISMLTAGTLILTGRRRNKSA